MKGLYIGGGLGVRSDADRINLLTYIESLGWEGENDSPRA